MHTYWNQSLTSPVHGPDSNCHLDIGVVQIGLPHADCSPEDDPKQISLCAKKSSKNPGDIALARLIQPASSAQLFSIQKACPRKKKKKKLVQNPAGSQQAPPLYLLLLLIFFQADSDLQKLEQKRKTM